MPAARLTRIIAKLRSHYGALSTPPAKGAFELILWEKVAYLATDERRAAAFDLFRRTVGLTPQRVLDAPRATIVETLIAGGIGAPERANNIIAAAEWAIGEFDGKVDDACSLPIAEAKRHLKRVRGIGDPGAEKILLFTRTHAVLGLDSNGLRVLTRLGYGVEAKTYATTYKSATTAALTELSGDFDTLIEANLLLRRHGQTLCKAAPKCGACPVRDLCPVGQRSVIEPRSLEPKPRSVRRDPRR